MAPSKAAFRSWDILANADADAPTEHAAGDRGADEGVVLEFGLLEGADDRGRVSQNRVDAAGSQVEVVSFGRLVFADVGDALEILVGEVRVDRRALDADGLALEEGLVGLDGLFGRGGLRAEVIGFARCRASWRAANSWPPGSRSGSWRRGRRNR